MCIKALQTQEKDRIHTYTAQADGSHHIVSSDDAIYNLNHQTKKLRMKLLRHFGQQTRFSSPNCEGDLIYSCDMSIGAAVQASFKAAMSESKQLEEAMLILHRYILDVHRNTPVMPWQPFSFRLPVVFVNNIAIGCQ